MTPEEARQVRKAARDAAKQSRYLTLDSEAMAALREKIGENLRLADVVAPGIRRVGIEGGAAATVEAPAAAPPRQATPAPARRQIKRGPDEAIARRVLKRHRDAAIALLEEAKLIDARSELREVEARLDRGTPRDCRYAAFAVRNLMQEVADHLLPATSEPHVDRSKCERSLGASDHKNRLIAYVERRLGGQLESHDLRAFVGTMDVIMRWAGSGPHGTYSLNDAENLYMRMLEALAVVGRAHAAADS